MKAKPRLDSTLADGTKSPYKNLLWMGLIHLPFMYAIMFTMVYSMAEVLHNLNTLYMAGMMVAPMFMMMPLFMRGMYANRKLNLIVYLSSIAIFGFLFFFMRAQTFIGDKQFLRSMIPHHSGAVLMCERAQLQDPEVTELCRKIIESQKNEIAQMEMILERL